MKTVFQHIEHIKGQPHHIRKRIAFTAATVGAGIIALIWLVSSATTGAFAVKGSSFADSVGQGSVEATANTDTSGIAGAAAAPVLENASAPAHIEIIDTASSASSTKKAEQTVIPF